jgi:hypothetical protein
VASANDLHPHKLHRLATMCSVHWFNSSYNPTKISSNVKILTKGLKEALKSCLMDVDDINHEVNDLLTATDSGKPFILLSLDISAAFTMLDHTRLLQRATKLFGLDDNVINWFKSYLTGRTSYVSFHNCHSSIVGRNSVPQGSVLGPLLFSIFTSPTGHLISSFNISYQQYADDTQLYTSIDPLSSTDITRLLSCAEAVTKWHLKNCLLFNPSKTKVLVTGTRPQITKFNNVTAGSNAFQFACTSECRSNYIRVLGVTIYQHLTFNNHVANIVQSCNYHIRGLCHIRQLIDKNMANTLACSIVGCWPNYSNALLYRMTQRNFSDLQ